MSILGKKIGTTRVAGYGGGKELVGIFDVEGTDIAAALNKRDDGAVIPLTLALKWWRALTLRRRARKTRGRKGPTDEASRRLRATHR